MWLFGRFSLNRNGVPSANPENGGLVDGCQKLTSSNFRELTNWYQRLSVTPAQKRIVLAPSSELLGF